MTEYKTIKEASSDEFIVKKSRFIGYVKPVKTQEEALEFINEIKTKHWDATHNVHAYCLREGGIRRFSDDGEPQGTAGIPSLDVLLKEEVVDCCVVVTRYFGGIMLGAGGLVRAYSHGAKIALDADDQIIGYKFVHLGKMMESIRKGMDANEAMEKASGQYGRFDDAVKVIDPREE